MPEIAGPLKIKKIMKKKLQTDKYNAREQHVEHAKRI